MCVCVCAGVCECVCAGAAGNKIFPKSDLSLCLLGALMKLVSVVHAEYHTK